MNKNTKKAIALAIALHMMIPYSAAYAETTQQAGTQALHERIQKILHPDAGKEAETANPVPAETPPEEPTPTEPETTDTEKEENPEKEQSTQVDWSKGNEVCPPTAFCDGVTDTRTNWSTIWAELAVIFGDWGSGSGDTIASSTTNPVDIATDTTSPTTVVDEGFSGGGDYSVFSNVYPSGTVDASWSDVPTGSEVSTGLLGGIPLSANASYSWVRQGPGALKIQALVYPLNPEIDSNTKFGAMVTSTTDSVHVYPPAQYASETYTKGGIQSKTFRFLTIEYAKNSKPRTGYVNVTVNANVYEGSTSLCSSDDADCNNGLVPGSEFDANGNIINNPNNTDGTTDVGGTIDPTTGGTTDTTGGTTTAGTDGSGTVSNSTNGSGFDLSGLTNWGNNSSNGTSGTSVNGSNPDWLQDGFASMEADKANSQDSTIPDSFGSQFADNGDGTATVGTDSSLLAQNQQEMPQGDQTPAEAGNAGNSGNYAASDTSESTEAPAAEMSFGDYVKSGADSALSGIFNKIDSAVGNDPAASGSLSGKLASLTGSNNSSKAGASAPMDANGRLPGNTNSANAADLQSLTDVATQMLLAYGRSPEDVKSGKLFDTGSAYTDPKDAWNLNRITAAKAQAQVKQTATTPIVK